MDTQPDSMLRVTAEPPLPGFDDSWLSDVDVTGFPEFWPPDESIAGPQSDINLYYEPLNPSRQRGSKSRRDTPDEDELPPSEGSYALEELFTDIPWEVESMAPLGMNLSRSPNEKAFNCFATDSIISGQMKFGSCSREPAKSLVPPCSKEKKKETKMFK